MKILHLFSDWKWTGPAEPVLNLCRELERRGHDVTLAYRRPPREVEESFEKRIFATGVKATDQFHLDHVLKLSHPSSFLDTLRDVHRLTAFLRREKFDVLNVHHSHDHFLGAIASLRLEGAPVLIRTDHKRDSIKPSWGNRFLLSRLTDGMVVFSEKARREDASHFGFPMERVCKITPALDLDRYDSKRKSENMKAALHIGPDEVVIGMVARFQKYRRTAVFLQAVKSIVKEFPKIKVLLVGRSSQMEESVVKPTKELGIEPWVILGGYRTDDYLDTLASMDLFVFLMAGSDGTARALREAMAMGKPVIVANRGMLPELVEDGISGWVVQDTAEALADVVLKMLRQPALRKAMGEAAYRKAHRDFRLDRQAEALEAFYQEMKHLGKWKRR